MQIHAPSTRKALGAIFAFLALLPYAHASPTTPNPCDPSTFHSLSLPGTRLISLTASLYDPVILDWTPYPALNFYPERLPAGNYTVCRVNITYTHTSKTDRIHTTIHLPLTWNTRLLGLGGGAWRGGYEAEQDYASVKGWASVTSDTGHEVVESNDPPTWALERDGDVDWEALENFAGRAVDEAARWGKRAVEAFYGRGVRRAYYNGCSAGGRQGYMLAQKYPGTYDGIVATAPAINWDRMVIGDFWPQLVMGLLDHFPPPCALSYIITSAIKACDPLDKVVDGIIFHPSACHFSPFTLINHTIPCPSLGANTTITITHEAAQFAQAAWTGPVDPSTGNSLWYGLSHSSNLAALARTACTSPTNCTGAPFSLARDWIRYFLLKDPDADLSRITVDEYVDLFQQSVSQFGDMIGTSNPNLSAFKEAGGKLLTWHGTSDEMIPFKGTVDYAQRVYSLDPDAKDYYRFFTAPGLAHCFGGEGYYPGGGLDALVQWVEEGKKPARLEARRMGDEGQGDTVELCLWPERLVYENGKDVCRQGSW